MNNGEHKTVEYAFYRRLGAVLSNVRRNKGLSIQNVAKRLKTSKTTVDNWELGKTRISWDKFMKLCEIYGISTDLKINVDVTYE